MTITDVNPKQPIRVYCIDDHPVILDGLRHDLSLSPRIKVIGTATDPEKGLIEIQALLNDVDVVVTDFEMPGMNGLQVCKAVKALRSSIKVVFYTMHNTELVNTKAHQAGANALLYKNSGSEEIHTLITNVMNGLAVIPTPVASAPKTGFPRVDLTPTERLIVKLVGCDCMTTRQIADHLHRSTHTIEAHRKNIMAALDIHTVQELVHYALLNRMCDDSDSVTINNRDATETE